MRYTVVCQDMVCGSNNKRKLRYSEIYVKNNSITGNAVVIYDNESNNFNVVSSKVIVSDKNALSLLAGYRPSNSGKSLEVDTLNTKFKGYLPKYKEGIIENYWSILQVGDKTIKVINSNLDIKAITLDNFMELVKQSRITNLFMGDNGEIDFSAYKKLDVQEKILDIQTINPIAHIKDEVTEKQLIDTLEIDLKQAENIKDSSEKEIETGGIIDENQQSEDKHSRPSNINYREKIAETDSSKTSRLSDNEIMCYKYIISKMDIGDILTIPIELLDNINSNIEHIIESKFGEGGNYTAFKMLVSIRIGDAGTIYGTLKFDGGNSLKFEAVTRYQLIHTISVNELIETIRRVGAYSNYGNYTK